VHLIRERQKTRDLIRFGLEKTKRHTARSRGHFRARRHGLFFNANDLSAHLDRFHTGAGRDLEIDFGAELETDGRIEKHAARAQVPANVRVRFVWAAEMSELHVKLDEEPGRLPPISSAGPNHRPES
jgi:hypothetical protein